MYTLGFNTNGFVPRAPRLNLTTPVVFHFAAERVNGYSVDLSESGILANFDRGLDIWLEGKLSVLIGERLIDVEARVVRVEGRMAALAFQDISNEARRMLQLLLEAASMSESMS